MQVISTLVPMALMAAVGIAAPAPTDDSTFPVKPLHGGVNGHGGDDIIVNAPWTVPIHHPHPRPPVEARDNAPTQHLDCKSDKDCLFGTVCQNERCTETAPINNGGTGPPVPPPEEYLNPSDSNVPVYSPPLPDPVPVHYGGVFGLVDGYLCTENADCDDGMLCLHHKCTATRPVERDTIPIPGHPDTYGNVCKEPGDCAPGSFCYEHRCTLPRDILGHPDTHGHVCKEPGDCAPGSFCYNHFCTFARDIPIPGIPDTYGNICNEHAECSPGSFCVDHACTFARGAEIKVEAEGTNLVKKDTPTTQEDYQAPCESHADCSTGSFCVDKRCTFSRAGETQDKTLPSPSVNIAEYQGPCNAHSDCASGSMCIAHWCTAATKLEDGSVNLAARGVVDEDEEFWYLESRAAVDVLDTLTGKTESVKAKNACPKTCGNGKHCCSHMFCQPPRCLGDFD